MLFWIVLAVALILYGLVAYMSSKNWQVGHVILLFFVSLFAMGGIILAAMNLRTQAAWREVHDKLTDQVTALETQLDQLEQGAVLSSDPDAVDIPTLKEELTRALIQRGRVWRGVSPVGADDAAITLSMQGWGDAACARVGIESENGDEFAETGEDGGQPPQPVAPPPHGITAGMILFAFAELAPNAEQAAVLYGDAELPERDQQAACRLPALYMGRFVVLQAEPAALRVAAVYPLSESQQKAIAPNVTWALYEGMAKDGHSIFEGWTREQLELIFRRPATVDPQDWQERIQEYVRDNQPANPGDLKENKWVQVRFLRDATVDVDAAGDDFTIERAFDPTGRATQPLLRQGAPTEFKQGDVALFSLVAAEQLLRNGDAELTEEPAIYRRPLRDYALILQTLHVDVESQQKLAELIAGDAASIALSTRKAQEQIAARERLVGQLQSDRQGFRQEQQAITAVVRELRELRAAQRRELSRLYQANIQLREQLRRRGAPLSILNANQSVQVVQSRP